MGVRAMGAAELVSTGDAGTELRTVASAPAFLSGAYQVVGAAPPFLPFPRFIPDDAGPLFVSHASCCRSQASKETASFHF